MSPPATPAPFLKCFVAVAKAESFAGGARLLGLSASAVSHTIARFEAASGVRLFHRSTHALSLTSEAELLLPRARAVCDALEAFDTALADLEGQGAGGRVRIGAPTAFLRFGLVPALAMLPARQPAIHLDLRGSDEAFDLAADGLDLVVRGADIDALGHLRRRLLSFRWVACAAPSYLARRGAPATPDDLPAHDLIGFRNQRTGSVDAWWFTDPADATRAVRAAPRPHLEVDDGNAALHALRQGIGIGWAPDWIVGEHLADGGLVEVLSDWSQARHELFLLRRPGRGKSNRVKVVEKFLLDWFKEYRR
jgi:DNA-binding transcriptional LysR family regulator